MDVPSRCNRSAWIATGMKPLSSRRRPKKALGRALGRAGTIPVFMACVTCSSINSSIAALALSCDIVLS